MDREKRGGKAEPIKPRRPAGEQFSDPLSWTPNMKAPGGAPVRTYRDEVTDRKEKEINAKILTEYTSSSLDFLKPLAGMVLVGLITFSRVDRHDMTTATIYAVMAAVAAGAVYTIMARDSMPSLISMIVKGGCVVALLGAGAWYLATHVDTSANTSKDSNYRKIRDEVVQEK